MYYFLLPYFFKFFFSKRILSSLWDRHKIMVQTRAAQSPLLPKLLLYVIFKLTSLNRFDHPQQTSGPLIGYNCSKYLYKLPFLTESLLTTFTCKFPTQLVRFTQEQNHVFHNSGNLSRQLLFLFPFCWLSTMRFLPAMILYMSEDFNFKELRSQVSELDSESQLTLPFIVSITQNNYIVLILVPKNNFVDETKMSCYYSLDSLQ